MTTELKCIIGGANCKGSITIAESVAPDATYMCSQCNVKPKQDIHFQDYANETDALDKKGRRKRQAKMTNNYFRDQHEAIAGKE